MPHYHFFYSNFLGQPTRVLHADCQNDDVALAVATREWDQDASVEVWDGARFVGEMDRPRSSHVLAIKRAPSSNGMPAELVVRNFHQVWKGNADGDDD